MLNRATFNRGWALLSGAFPEFLRGMDPAQVKSTIAVYWESLKDFDERDFEKVIKNTIYQTKYFPKISELRAELVHLKGFHRLTATQAWDNLMRAAESGERPEMDENTERALAVCGGWDIFQFTSYRDLQFLRRDFENRYNEGLERDNRQLKLGEDKSEKLRIAERKRLESK